MRQVTPSTNTYLLIDKREKHPMLLQALKTLNYKHKFVTLTVGDYACSDLCCFCERKQDDFTIGNFGSMNRQLANMQVAATNARCDLSH